MYEVENLRGFSKQKFSVIHGYNSGTVLKCYLNSRDFIEDMKKPGVQIMKMGKPNPGKMNFEILGFD